LDPSRVQIRDRSLQRENHQSETSSSFHRRNIPDVLPDLFGFEKVLQNFCRQPLAGRGDSDHNQRSRLQRTPVLTNRRASGIIQGSVKNPSQLDFHRFSLGAAILVLVASVACTQPRNSQDLKEHTAEATAAAKRDAKAVAAGIKEGWSRDKPLDVNSASKEDLTALPGINSADADKILEGRPYDSPNDLLSRRILSKSKFDQIAERVTAKK
jgi:competence protein ComEA